MSIKTKLNLILLVLGLSASCLIAAVNYMDARERIYQDAYKKAELINSFALAARTYTVKTMRPLALEIAGMDQFHPEIMGGFFVARSISETFAESQPGYSFKQATLNPINPANQADAFEKEVITAFDRNPDLTLQKGVVARGETQFFYLSRPVTAQKGCLLCHGDPEKAPKGRRTRYPGPGGYGYGENSVIATFITYVPVADALAQLKAIAIRTAGVGAACILLILAVLWVVLDRLVTRPVLQLSSLADDISRGKGLDTKFETSSKDEIGDLYQAFERMRRSVVKLMKMVQQKR